MQIVPFRMLQLFLTKATGGEIFRYTVPDDTVLQLEYFSAWNKTDTNARYYLEIRKPQGDVAVVTVLTNSITDVRYHVFLVFVMGGETLIVRHATDTKGVEVHMSAAGWLLRGVEGAILALPN